MKMNNEEPNRPWERALHERLRALPEPQAPADLVPKVWERITQARERVWWRKPWFQWPRGMQVLSGFLLLGVLTAVGVMVPNLNEILPHWTGSSPGHFQFLHALGSVAGALGDAAVAAVGMIRTPYLIAGGILIALVYFSTVGLAAVFYRVAAANQTN